MAGITNADFCLKLIPYGFDMVTLGGYNADNLTATAGKKMIKRGRPEFDIEPQKLPHIIKKESEKIKKYYSDVLVSVNLRSVTPDPIIKISKIKSIDIIEINAHCRQKEIIELGCGQALLYDLDFLEEYVTEVVKKAHKPVSVKFRANVPGVDEREVASLLDDIGCDYIHFDAMKPGADCADLNSVKKVSSAIKNAFLIGNNSIRDIKSARNMLKSGADGISIARAALGGKIDFDLKKI